ncbi:MAG: metal ABC transporter substrate-binding protein, partial [Bacilli bacterium]
MKKTFAYMMALPIILALNGCYNDAEYTNFVNSDKIKIVATTSIVANFAQEIGQDRVVIYNMIKSGMDAHTYNTTPADLKYLKAADLILTSGLELESRIEDVLDSFSSSKDKAFYTLSDGLDSTDLLEASHEEDEGDEGD